VNNECRHCLAWIRWAKVNGKWKPFGTDAKVHNCAERWKVVKARGPQPRPKSTDYAEARKREREARDSKMAAANDHPEKESA
jgi:hypothetical protein